MGSSITLSDIGIRLSDQDADFQRTNVADLLHLNSTRFPGAQPVSFASKHLAELRKRDYFMCEKTDGVRCVLYLTQIFIEGESVEAQFLIDRKNDYYYIPQDALHIPTPRDFASFHVGTLLDGELVRQTFKSGVERLAYLIFDCLAIDSEEITQKPFDKRLARVHEFIAKPSKLFAKQYPSDVAAQPFQLEMKAMEFSYGMEMMFRDRIPNLPHGNDGLIFTCKGTPYHPGTDEHILKWKPPEENTIDFRLLLGAFPVVEDEEGEYEDWDSKPEMELHINYGSSYQKFGGLRVTEQEWTAMKGMNQPLDGRIIECYRDSDGAEWRPKLEKDGTPRFREDKKDANHISVVRSVVESIEDSVTEDVLIGEASRIKVEYKKRQREEADRAQEEQRRAHEAEKRRAQQDVEAKRRASVMEKEKMEQDSGPTYED